MGQFEDANKLVILNSGHTPNWTMQEIEAAFDAIENGIPSGTENGNYMKDSTMALILATLRENAAYRTSYIEVDTLDTGATYTVTIDGNDVTSATPTDVDDLLVDLKAAIEADVDVDAIVACELLDETGKTTLGTAADGEAAVSLRLTGKTEEDYTIAVDATAGAISALTELSACDIRLWITAKSISQQVKSNPELIPAGWHLLDDSEVHVGTENLAKHVPIPSCKRVYIEVMNPEQPGDGEDNIQYSLKVYAGPTILQSEA